jgi:YVTN family beta-propeller protein
MISNKIHCSFFAKAGCLLLLVVAFFACDDMEDKTKPENTSGIYCANSIYILSEGLINMNNSTLAKFNFQNQELNTDYFLSINNRGLGDTGNDMAIYGSKLYIVVNVSGSVEVINAGTGSSLKQIKLINESNISRQPRYIAFNENKAYVCNFDGTVCRIDTATLQIEATVECGENPDGICVANGKLYVSNSGGLNYPNYDNTVSVIDLATFTEVKKITVAINPGKILSDNEGDVYLVSRGDYGNSGYKFQKINSVRDELVQTFDDINALNFTIHNDTAYIYNYDFNTKECWIKVFDCLQDNVISENFITDSTTLITPYGIDVNPKNGDVYVTDAKNYLVYGNIFCFDNTGKLRFQLKEIGMNPNKVVFR